jgi:hypothetical protein
MAYGQLLPDLQRNRSTTEQQVQRPLAVRLKELNQPALCSPDKHSTKQLAIADKSTRLAV